MLLPYKSRLSDTKIILASASPRRKYALEELGLKFSIIPSTFAEDLDKSQFPTPAGYVLETARLKVLDVYQKLKADTPDLGKSKTLIVGADSIVILNGKILEKPSSVDHAKSMLSELSESKHSVITAVIFVVPVEGQEPNVVSFYEETFVKFTKLAPEMIDAYVATGTPMDKAGGYGIQEVIGGSFIESITGCYYNVTGFPVNRFCRELIKLWDSGSWTENEPTTQH